MEVVETTEETGIATVQNFGAMSKKTNSVIVPFVITGDYKFQSPTPSKRPPAYVGGHKF